VVAQPHRRDILRLIWTRELAVGEIARHFDVTQGSISQHLAILREAGLVRRRNDGNRRLYQADQDAVGELRPYLERMWASSLDRLSTAIVEDQQAGE
jgi:DNA-binding transcriptional ArsR family regulator